MNSIYYSRTEGITESEIIIYKSDGVSWGLVRWFVDAVFSGSSRVEVRGSRFEVEQLYVRTDRGREREMSKTRKTLSRVFYLHKIVVVGASEDNEMKLNK